MMSIPGSGFMGIGSGGNWLNTGMDRVMERALDASALRQQFLVNNIANVETPGFRRTDVDFNATLKQAMQQSSVGVTGRRTREQHFEISQVASPYGAVLAQESWYLQRNDENNVSIEVENASRDQNQIIYSAAAQLYGDRLKWLGIVLDSRG